MTDGPRDRSPDDDTCSDDKTLTGIWERWRDGGAVSIEQVLAQAAKLTPRQLTEVLLEDQERRWRRGDPVSVESYLERFPQLGEDAEAAVDLIYNEFLLASQAETDPIACPEQYLERFPKFRAELCRQFDLDQALADSELAETRAGAAGETGDGPGDKTWVPRKSASYKLGDFGEYGLLEEIARGGMGRVFKADQRNANRIVALKMILGGETAGADEVKRFYREAEAVASLQHPNIVPVFDVGAVEGQHFYTMAYVDGPNLQERVNQGPLPTREAADLVRQVASAVAYAHQQGIVHRDLKPSNILLDQDNTPRVSDLGLVKIIGGQSDLTATGEPMGTLAFMAPEQAVGAKTVSTRSDIYSLGAVLYCLLTGRPPFDGATRMDTWRQVVECQPLPPRQLNAKISRDLETVCLKCLDMEPWRRYGSAQELSDELQSVLQGRPIKARPISTTARCWRWCRRNPFAAVLAGLIVMLAIGGPLLAWRGSWLVKEKLSLLNDKEQAFTRVRRGEERALAGEAEAIAQAQLATDRLEQSRRAIYDQQLLLASRELKSDPQQALRLLQDGEHCRPAFLDFTYHYLYRLANRDRRELFGHTEAVTCIAFSPNGRLLASGSEDHSIRLWDAETSELRATLTGHQGFVLAIDFSPDGRQLALGGADGKAIVWDTATGDQLDTIYVGGRLFAAGAVAFSPDGNSLVVGAGPLLGSALVDIPSPIIVSNVNDRTSRTIGFHSSTIADVAFRANGLLVAADWQGVIKVWNVAEGKVLHEIELQLAPKSMALSPNGAVVVAGTSEPQMWDVEHNTLTRRYRGHAGYVRAVAVSPTGRTLVSGGDDKTLRVWDTLSGENLSTFEHGHTILSVAISPDGRHLAFGGHDNTVHLWNARTLRDSVLLAQYPRGPLHVAVSRDDSTLAVAHQTTKTLDLWDMATMQLIKTLQPPDADVESLALSDDGMTLARVSANRTVQVWNREDEIATDFYRHDDDICAIGFLPASDRLVIAASEVIIVRGSGHQSEFRHHLKDPSSMAISPDGQRIALGSSGWGHYLVDLREPNGEMIKLMPSHESWIARLAFSQDRTKLASSSGDGQIKIWDVASHELLQTILARTGAAVALAFDSSGDTLASSSGRAIRLWDTVTGQQRGELAGHGGEVVELFFHDNNELLVSAADDGSLRLWKGGPDQTRKTLIGHEAKVVHVCFAPDGKTLHSASRDKTIRAWDVATGRSDELCVLERSPHENAVAFSPDGRWIASSNGTTVKLRGVKLGVEAELRYPYSDVNSLSFSPDSTTLIAGRWAEAFVWDLESYTVTRDLVGPDQNFISVFSPDGGQLASVGWAAESRCTLRIWDTASWSFKDLHTYAERLVCAAYSANGKRLAVAGNDTQVYVWDMSNFKEFPALAGHTDVVRCVAFSPDGQTLASAGHEGTIRLWDVGTLRERAAFYGHPHHVNSLAFSPDGTILASAGSDRTIKLWPVGRNE